MGRSNAKNDEISLDVLLHELRESQTDLARLVEQVVRRKLSRVAVCSKAVTAWEQRAPEAWAKVCKWLTAQGVTIVIV